MKINQTHQNHIFHQKYRHKKVLGYLPFLVFNQIIKKGAEK